MYSNIHATDKQIKSFPRYLLYTVLLFVLGYMHLSLSDLAYDDAYIHFRIAEHLAEFGEPYYNLSEAIKASSSSGWTILLALLFSLSGSHIVLVALFNAAVLTGLCALSSRIVKEHTEESGFLIDITISILVLSITYLSSVGLMETPFALLLLSTGLLLYMQGKDLSFIFFGIAPFFRPELIIFAILFFLHRVIRDDSIWNKGKVVAISLGSALPFLAYDLYYFQTLIPNTVGAKSIIYDLSYRFVLLSVAKTYPFLDPLLAKKFWFLCSFILAGYICYFTYRNRRKASNYVVQLLLLGGITLVFLYVFKKTFLHGWYHPLYLYPILISSYIILYKNREWIPRILFLAIVIPFILNFGKSLSGLFSTQLLPLHPDFRANARVQQYLSVSKEIDESCRDCTMLSSEIGGLGYHFSGKVFDGVGLITPKALKYHPLDIPEERPGGDVGAIPLGYAKEVDPDIIVSHPVFNKSFLNSDFKEKYVLKKISVFPEKYAKLLKDDELWGSRFIDVFIRNDIYNEQFFEK